MPGTAAVYSLVVPSDLGKLPGNLRPTIRVGPKQVAIATSPELARQALEVRPADAWAPPAELVASFAKLPSGLVALSVSDPRDTLPKALAGLPGQLQASINTAILRAATPPAGPTPPGGTTPPAGPDRHARGARRPRPRVPRPAPGAPARRPGARRPPPRRRRRSCSRSTRPSSPRPTR